MNDPWAVLGYLAETGIEYGAWAILVSPVVFIIDPAMRSVDANIYTTWPPADSLPDRHGNKLIDRWLAQTGRYAKDFNTVDRLYYAGSSGMGAIELNHQRQVLWQLMSSTSINPDI